MLKWVALIWILKSKNFVRWGARKNTRRFWGQGWKKSALDEENTERDREKQKLTPHLEKKRLRSVKGKEDKEDEREAETVQMCPLRARPFAPLLENTPTRSLQVGRCPQQGCALCLSKVTQEEVESLAHLPDLTAPFFEKNIWP